MSKLIGPKISPKDTSFGFGSKDTHLVINDDTEICKAFDYHGEEIFRIGVSAKGVAGPDWRYKYADCPPGLYRLGAVYDDKWKVDNGIYVPDHIKLAFGWITFDMESLEGQEAAVGRGGICAHSGGSVHGWRAWDSRQPYLAKTHGCCRFHNEDLYYKVYPRVRQGNVFASVYQDVV